MIMAGEDGGTRRKSCPSAILSTTNSTRTGLGQNMDLRGKRPATNGHDHGTAHFYGGTEDNHAVS